jgi:uncharacterized protein YqeY
MSIVKIQQSIKEQINNNLTTKEDVAQALINLQFLKKGLVELDKHVRNIASEMFEEDGETKMNYDLIDQNTGEIKQFYISERQATVTKEYNPVNIFEAFGPNGLNFMKVKKTAVDSFIREGLKEGAIDPSMADLALSGAIEKTRAGGITVKEIK